MGVGVPRLDYGLYPLFHDFEFSRRPLEGRCHQNTGRTLWTAGGITGRGYRHEVGDKRLCAYGRKGTTLRSGSSAARTEDATHAVKARMMTADMRRIELLGILG